MTDRLSTATMRCEIKALGQGDDEGTFEGFGSTFGGKPDSFGDVIARGAFAKTLKEHEAAGTMPALLWQHDTWSPIGRWLEMTETARGLKVKGKLTLGVRQAQEAHALMLDEAVDGLSIGFRTRKSEPLNGGGRQLTEIELLEVSIVTMPANGRARVTGVKAEDGSLGSERDFERLLMRDAGLSRSEAIVVINDGYKALLSMRDAGDRGLETLLEAIQRTTATIQGAD